MTLTKEALACLVPGHKIDVKRLNLGPWAARLVRYCLRRSFKELRIFRPVLLKLYQIKNELPFGNLVIQIENVSELIMSRICFRFNVDLIP